MYHTSQKKIKGYASSPQGATLDLFLGSVIFFVQTQGKKFSLDPFPRLQSGAEGVKTDPLFPRIRFEALLGLIGENMCYDT